jgi:tRNA(Ile2) C34 agmatinyltransferase TiaS
MKKYYAVFEYLYDHIKETYSDLKGPIKAFVDADDPFEACEKAGLTDATRYFADVVYPETYGKIMKDINEETELLGKLKGQLEGMVAEHKEELTKCPNCEKKLNEKGECKECGYGRDEIAIDGNIITKKMWEAHEKAMKKAANKAKKVAKAKPTVK